MALSGLFYTFEIVNARFPDFIINIAFIFRYRPSAQEQARGARRRVVEGHERRRGVDAIGRHDVG